MGYWRDPKRKDWIYRFQFQGKNYGGRGYKTKAAARIARSEHQKSLKNESIPAIAGMAFKKVAYAYLDYSERRHSEKTYKGKRFAIECFFKFIKKENGADIPIASIAPHIIELYLKSRPSNNNFNVHRKELYSLFTYARKTLRIIDYNPCWDVDKMPHTAARKKIPTEKQILKLIVAADPGIERPLLLTAMHTLARIDEILRLIWQDVNFEKRMVTLWTRKRKGGSYEADPMPMNKDLYDVLWRLWKSRKQNRWVFFNERTDTRYHKRPKFMRGLCKRAFAPEVKSIKEYKGPLFGFHTLRHFMASYLADRKKLSTKTLQQLLRHKEQRTTEIYLHSIDESSRLALESIEGEFSLDMVSGDGVASDRKGAKKPTPGANHSK